MNEAMMIDLIKTVPSLEDIERTTDKMCKHDAENDSYILELKSRRGKHYPDTLIEKAKYDYLMSYADKTGRTPLYVISSGGHTCLLYTSPSPRDS